MSARALLPGGLIAAALTACAVLALLIALGLRGNGPLPLGLGGADSSARLDGGAEVEPSGPRPGPGGGGETTRVVLPGGRAAPAAPATAVAPARRRSAPLRGVTRGRRGAGRGGTRTPARRAPATPQAPSNTTAPAPATARPVATSTPNPNPVKVRGRGRAPQRVVVNKQRVTAGNPAATPGPVPMRPVPPPTPPDLERRTAPTPTPGPSTGVGADDGVLHRVPPPGATP